MAQTRVETTAATQAQTPRGINHVVLNVRNLDVSHRFWTEIMGFKCVAALKPVPGRVRPKMRFYSGVDTKGDVTHHDLALCEVPADTPFIAITRAVIDELTADQVRAVRRVVDQQEIFARATLREGVPGVVAALSQALSATAVVIGTDGRPLAATGRDTEHVIASTAEAARNMRPHSGRRHASRVIADGAGYCTIQTVRAAQTPRGYLAVRSDVALSALDRLLVAHALSLISIELEKPAKVIDAEQRLRDVRQCPGNACHDGPLAPARDDDADS